MESHSHLFIIVSFTDCDVFEFHPHFCMCQEFFPFYRNFMVYM